MWICRILNCVTFFTYVRTCAKKRPRQELFVIIFFMIIIYDMFYQIIYLFPARVYIAFAYVCSGRAAIMSRQFILVALSLGRTYNLLIIGWMREWVSAWLSYNSNKFTCKIRQSSSFFSKHSSLTLHWKSTRICHYTQVSFISLLSIITH
jgi:hypothetical protein